ncbi:MAG: hypothetical protein HUU21_24570 [Polyangiaceae bacterium]|nr:hypothetical protein [Polyangiaceae bacterium]
MDDDQLQIFMIDADLSGQFLQDMMINQMSSLQSRRLDYSRGSLVFAAQALLEVLKGNVLHDPQVVTMRTAQYLGETILNAVEGQWSIHEMAIDLQIVGRQSRAHWIDVYAPCVELVRLALRRQTSTVEPTSLLLDVFDQAVANGVERSRDGK